MRHFIAPSVALACLLLVIVSPPLKTAANDWKIVPGDRIGDVYLTVSEDDVLKLLGPPDRTSNHIFVWLDHQLIVATTDGLVEVIEFVCVGCKTPSGPIPLPLPYRTDKGIGLGARMPQVREAYGDSGCVFKDQSSGDRILVWPGLGIKFEFGVDTDYRLNFQGGVVGIEVRRPNAGSMSGRPCSELG